MSLPGTVTGTDRPNMARVYDVLLGGNENLDADRRLAAAVEAAYPPPKPGRLAVPREMARRNREFVARSAAWCAQQGARQFLDLGAGLQVSRPLRNVHEAAGRGATCAYVDCDGDVVALTRAQLAGVAGVAVAGGDLRCPEAVMDCPEVRAVISLDRPVVLIAAMVLHLLDADEAAAVMAGWAGLLPPGSYVIVSCPRWEDEGLFGRVRAACTAAELRNHGAGEVASFFGGAVLLPPGITPARAWRPSCPTDTEPDGSAFVLAGIARKQAIGAARMRTA